MKQLVNPKGTEGVYESLHFSQAVRAGNVIWVSGQIGIDERMKPVEGMTAQARLAFENIRRILEATGAALDDVVELTTFHTDIQGEMREFMKVKDEFFPKDYPAWTAVGVTQLAFPGVVIEIRAVASVDS